MQIWKIEVQIVLAKHAFWDQKKIVLGEIAQFEDFGVWTHKICDGASGVARGVAGVAEATPIFQFLFNRFGQKVG